ncbi:pancreatic lipase-related protein 2-like [Haemaphysalis longicornis]
MNFFPLLVAMTGVHSPDGHANSTNFHRALKARTVYDTTYMYGELTKEDLADIALSVKRHEEMPYLILAATSKPLSFPELPGTFDLSGNLNFFVPQSPSKVKPQFLLYSNKAKNSDKLLFETGLDPAGFSKLGSQLNHGHKLYFVVHGFLSSAKTPWMLDMKNEILSQEPNVGVVLVDWSNGCGSLLGYSTAAANTRVVARSLAFLVQTLTEAGVVSPKDVHYIGHSLGAQTGGFFGQDVKTLTGQVVGRITGLDPAGPQFESRGVHLRKDDAVFVDVLHTSTGSGWTDIVAGHLGMASSCGHVDFYPNGGRQQPGCWHFTSCSHSKSTEYYSESVYSCQYPTRSCPSYDAYVSGACNPQGACQEGELCGRMGHPAHLPVEGDHYTETDKVRCLKDPHPLRVEMLALQLAVSRKPHSEDDLLLKSLGRSAQVLLKNATPEERQKLLDYLRENKMHRKN